MQFEYETLSQRIVFGVGESNRLKEIVNDFGWQRVLLCTSPHLKSNRTVDKIAASLGELLAAVFDQTAAHVPYDQVVEMLSIARKSRCDALIALGGGSAIGLAKAVSYSLSVEHSSLDHIAKPILPIIAIPTTYAGSEMTPIFGVTHEQADGSKRKVTMRDVRITPTIVIYDPQLTLDLPAQITASSGVNALAHCIEAVYSTSRNPLSTAAALRGITYITHALPKCAADGHNLAARSEMLEGTHLAGVSLATVAMGIHHGTGHVLGGTAGVPHGVANCIVLPHAMRFNADVAAEELAVVAEAMGVVRNGRSDYEMALAAADTTNVIIGNLNMPQRLQQIGVTKSLLPLLAQNLLLSKAVRSNPKALTSEDQALAYLQGMW